MSFAQPRGRASAASLIAAMALGSACGDSGGATSEAVASSSSGVTVCAAGETLRGIDVSEYQGSIDWGKVAASGVSFAIARVSDGTDTLDPEFSANWSGIKAAGMTRGAYQFFRASEDPTGQANLLVAAIAVLEPDDLSPIADVEVMDGESGSTLVAHLALWVARIETLTGRAPIVYASPDFWNQLPDTGQFSSLGAWVADWGATCPETAAPWANWQFWQHADDGSVPGIGGAVDLDAFNGTPAQLRDLGGTPPYAAEYVSQSFPLATSALVIEAGQIASAYVELKNIGTQTWDSRTRLATTEPRDRASLFEDATWIDPTRPAGVKGTVAPGASYTFQFDLRAPDVAGTYFEHFGVVQEGVAWFGDPGQGGPPDSDLEAQVLVVQSLDAGLSSEASSDLADGAPGGDPGLGTRSGDAASARGSEPDDEGEASAKASEGDDAALKKDAERELPAGETGGPPKGTSPAGPACDCRAAMARSRGGSKEAGSLVLFGTILLRRRRRTTPWPGSRASARKPSGRGRRLRNRSTSRIARA